MFISFLAGLVLLVEYFFDIPVASKAGSEIQSWAVVIAAFALALAAINLIWLHLRSVAKGGREGLHSILLVGSLVVTFISGAFSIDSKVFSFIVNGIYVPLGTAFYAMTGFYLASAAYRAFRAKNAQAAVLLVTGILLIVGRAPIGEVVWKGFPKVADWIMMVPSVAGSRGIIISTSIGLVGMGLRILLGIERSHLGNVD